MFRKLWNIIIKIFRYFKKNTTLNRVALSINIGVALTIFFLAFQLFNMFIEFDNRVGVFHSYMKREIETVITSMISLGTLAIENDFKQIEITKGIVETTKGIQDNIEKISKVIKRLRERLALSKLIKIENIEDIKKANLEIVNITEGIFGSGSYIKLKNKKYVLTCAHLVHKKNNEMQVFINKKMFSLELIKIDNNNDLALFKIHKFIENFPYLEISKEYPTEGSEIVVIGNPDGLEDVITDGIIAKERKRHYVFTNKVYFGNSGGAVLYRGKIVGITSYTQVLYDTHHFVNYGVAVKLKVIKEFLKAIN